MQNGRERIVQLMGDPRDEPAQRGKLLGLPERLLNRAQRSDVFDESFGKPHGPALIAIGTGTDTDRHRRPDFAAPLRLRRGYLALVLKLPHEPIAIDRRSEQIVTSVDGD